ncbi:TetR/AcrR family transcriptional regulator [Caballeronia sp. Lep1P3]|uniref:TetR/AcrR family transcriptional regulator n=1 Tax=Caballeronia sp. Lep1P3 TaxID=2878150 RepID=UPI001FD528EA|nr:TetR/AcrR family transcriptional regulator [Caballeronia sp. Lep1P3]
MSQYKRDPEGTRRKILKAATEQFTSFGLAGARIDAIASAAGANERMLYYYFQSKEGLYVAVLEAMYADFASREGSLNLSGLQPSDAVRSLAGSIWTHLRENPRWLRLINNENLHEGRFIERSSKLRETISPIVGLFRTTLARGAAAGEFRADVDALDFYVTVVGMGYYVVSNRFTLRTFTGRDYSEQSAQNGISAMHVDMLLSYLRSRSAQRF